MIFCLRKLTIQLTKRLFMVLIPIYTHYTAKLPSLAFLKKNPREKIKFRACLRVFTIFNQNLRQVCFILMKQNKIKTLLFSCFAGIVHLRITCHDK